METTLWIKPESAIHARVHLHAEVPLLALLGLVHLGVALAVLVLGRARRGDDGGVHHRALAHQQTALGEVRVDLGQDRCGQIMLLEQAAELQQRRGVGHVLAPQVDADELAHGLAVVQRVFQRLVGQRVPLLQEVHAQHARHADRRATDLAALGVVRLDQRFKPRPRHDRVHLGQEPLAPRLALLAGVLGTGKAGLLHGRIVADLRPERHRGVPG